MTVAWPDAVLVERCSPELRNFAASGGRTGNGREQRVFHDAGFWEIGVDLQLRDETAVRAYRAMKARLRQGEDILVRLCDLHRARGQAPIRTIASAPLRATSISLVGIGAALREGHHFTVGQRLYLVTEIVSDTTTNTGLVTGTYTGDTWDDADVWVDDPEQATGIRFIPPLRAAAPAGTRVAFDELVCLCVLKDMDDGDLDLDVGRFGAPSMTFIESI